MICIIIPVYLETRLIYEEEAVLVSTQLRNAFVITSRIDPEFPDLFKAYPEGYKRAFDICSYVDEDEWLVASTVNVSFVRDEASGSKLGSELQAELLYEANCIKSTEQALLRVIPPGEFREKNDAVREREVTVDFSRERYAKLGTGINIVNLSVWDENDVQCFARDLYLNVHFMCHRVCVWHRRRQRSIDFFATFVTVNITSTRRKLHGRGQTGPDLAFSPESRRSMLVYGMSVEFHDKCLFDAEVMASAGLSVSESTSRFYEQLGTYLYSRRENVTVIAPTGEVAVRTVLDRVVVTIGAIHLGVIITFALCMRLMAVWTMANRGLKLGLRRRQLAGGWKHTYEVVYETGKARTRTEGTSDAIDAPID